jgi:hypothetical protein
MGRSKKLKSVKSPPKPHKPASSPKAKKSGRMCKKTAAAIASEAQQSERSNNKPEEPSSNTVTLKAPTHVVWDKYPDRTERLLDYLDMHPEVAIKLFGDSTQAAKLEGRSKLTAKSNKSTAYLQVADGVFSVDDDPAVQADFAANLNKYAKAVNNISPTCKYRTKAPGVLYLTTFIRLKKQYRAVNKRIGKTGAGLKPEDITPDSEIANLIGM